jgi:hypothetical protein
MEARSLYTTRLSARCCVLCFWWCVFVCRRCRHFHIVAFSQSEPSSSVVPLSPVVMFVFYVYYGRQCRAPSSSFRFASPLSFG